MGTSKFADQQMEEELAVRHWLYMVCGSCVLLTNLLCFCVFNSTREFRKRFLFFSMLSFSDMVNGASFVVTGIGRNVLIAEGRFLSEITSVDCLTRRPWPLLLLLGGQLPAVFNALLAVERVIAVSCMSWYHSVWGIRHRIYLAVAGVVACLALDTAALLNAVYSPLDNPNQMCAVMNSVGRVYGTIHFTWISIVYTSVFAVICLLYAKSWKIKSLNVSEKRKQLAVLLLTGGSVALVAIPNLVIVLDEWTSSTFNVLFVGVAYCFYGLQSCTTLPIFYFFRSEFRYRLHTMLFIPNSAPSSRKENNVRGEVPSMARKSASSIYSMDYYRRTPEHLDVPCVLAVS